MSGRRRSPPLPPRSYNDAPARRDYRDDRGAASSSHDYRRRRSPSPQHSRSSSSRYESDRRDRDDRDDWRSQRRERDRDDYRSRDRDRDDRQRDRAPPPPRDRPDAYQQDACSSRDYRSAPSKPRQNDDASVSSSRGTNQSSAPPSTRAPSTSAPNASDTHNKPIEQEEQDDGEAGEEDGDEDAMAAMMGFGGFGTTKGKKVTGNAAGAAEVKKERTWRQYMNRKGGFNRPLDKIK